MKLERYHPHRSAYDRNFSNINYLSLMGNIIPWLCGKGTLQILEDVFATHYLTCVEDAVAFTDETCPRVVP